MKNPNAVAALSSGSLTLAVEQLVQHYASAYLPPLWANVVLVAVPVAVLYIGRDGVSGALARLVATVRAIWKPAK